VLSEHKELQLGAPEPSRHLGVLHSGQLVAAAVLAQHGDVWNIELVARERSEHARMVAFDAAMVDCEGSWVQLWEPTSGLSVELDEAISRYDVEETRTLLHLTRDLIAHPPDPRDREVQTFDVAAHAEIWIEANNETFASHREQGAWTLSTLQDRLRQPWFDPTLFLVEGGDEIAAWCWCKVDASTANRGEIYVIGTHPRAQGKGFGRRMLENGCAEMAARGVSVVDLYVDGDNTAALALYDRAHFVTTSIRRSWLFS
jgi:mycothiol synthase